VIMSDLLLLSNVLQDISSHKELAPSVKVGLECCLTKVMVSSLQCSQVNALLISVGT
jgi:hypothetical protein